MHTCILAGLIATSNSIIGGLLTLMHHYDVVIQMRTELDHVIGKERLPTSKDQLNLPYCHAVILEVLRYTTVVPLVNHFWYVLYMLMKLKAIYKTVKPVLRGNPREGQKVAS